MKTEALVRMAIITGLLNLAMTATLLIGRPDLAVRDSAEKLYVYAEELEKQANYPEATKIYENIFYNMSTTLIAPQAGERLADIYRRRLFDVDKARSVLREAAAYKESYYAEQAKKDLLFMDTHWGSDGSVLKIWYQASNANRNGDMNGSLKLLDSIITEHGDSSLKPLAIYRSAKVLQALKRNPEALQRVREFLLAYPNDPQVPEARKLEATLR